MHCDCTTDMKVFVPFKETRREWAGDPKYTFHIKQVCFNCHKFNGFIKQTEQLMDELGGGVIMKLDLEERDLPFSED